MKRVAVKKLQRGDLVYYKDSYWEVANVFNHLVSIKHIVGPTANKDNYLLLTKEVMVNLLCRDGVEV